jgi:glucose/mannose transport system permease protein
VSARQVDGIVRPKTAASTALRWLLFAILGLFALYYLMPLIVMVMTALKPLDEIRTGSLISPPRNPTLEPAVRAWNSACVGVRCAGLKPYMWNSILMVVPAVVISTMLGAINGYALTKWRFRGADLIFGLMLFGAFIPFQVVLLPMARTLGALGLAGSVRGLVLVHTVYGLAFTTLFFRNFFVGVSDGIVQAAKVDGAGFFGIFFRVVAPMAPPAFVVTVIWQFTQIWNDFLFGIAFSAGDSNPATVALNNLVASSTGVKEYNVDMAAAIIAAVPTLLVYVFAGKYFIRGLSAGALKG